MGNIFNFNWEVELMQFLQSHMNKVTAGIASFISCFGEDMYVVLLLGFLYWCHDKKKALKVGINMMLAGILCPMIKNTARRVRPYMAHEEINCLKPIDPEADIYDITAQGYSFPSGHSINSSSSVASLAYYFPVRLLKMAAVILPLLVGLSRICLGVHYPTDVLAGWFIGYGCVFLMPILEKKFKNDDRLYLCMFICALVGVFYCRTNDYFTGIGIMGGLLLGNSFEERHVQFDKPENIMSGILRLGIGALLFPALNMILKLPFSPSLLNSHSWQQFLVRSIRYAVIVFVEIGIYPMVFGRFVKDNRQSE